MKRFASALALAAATATSSAAFAASQDQLQLIPAASKTYGVVNITANNAADAAAGQNQLSVTVTDAGPGIACFTFHNEGAQAMTITNIYFENTLGQLTGSPSIQANADTSYTTLNGNLNLPGGNQPAVNFSEAYGIKPTSQGGKIANAINLGEELTVCFNLTGSFQELITALDTADRVGFHVQAFDSEGSESFVTVPNAVPTPSAVGLGMGLLGLAAARRRREQSPDA